MLNQFQIRIVFHYIFKVYFYSDTVYLILVSLFSLTNGYLGSICMTFGPKMMTNPHEQGQAASLLVFFLVFGLAIGSAISPLTVKLL
jgi:equilibrative nucleoside transporter 1/2/3